LIYGYSVDLFVYAIECECQTGTKRKEIEGKLCKIKQRKAKKHSTATNENRTP